MPLRVAYINTEGPNPPKARKQTEKQLIHELALARLAELRVINKQKAKDMFKEEWAALEIRKQALKTQKSK